MPKIIAHGTSKVAKSAIDGLTVCMLRERANTGWAKALAKGGYRQCEPVCGGLIGLLI